MTEDITVAADAISIDNVSFLSPEGSFVVGRGDIGSLSGDVSGLDGSGCTLTIDWGANQSPDTIQLPPSTDPLQPVDFTLSHHYLERAERSVRRFLSDFHHGNADRWAAKRHVRSTGR